eukprot:scaffold16982_cov17-Tisochrysis_lutea.AAC.3
MDDAWAERCLLARPHASIMGTNKFLSFGFCPPPLLAYLMIQVESMANCMYCKRIQIGIQRDLHFAWGSGRWE